MATRPVMTTYCDNHALMGETVIASGEHVLGVGTRKALVDLCAECETVVLGALLALIRTGRPTEAPLKPRVKGGADAAAMPLMCPECGKHSKSRGVLSNHLATQHGRRLRNYPNSLRAEADYAGLPYHF